MTIKAIYENGIFRPTEPVDLPDRSAVSLQATLAENEPFAQAEARRKTLAILSRSFPTGETDAAERHNEHGIVG